MPFPVTYVLDQLAPSETFVRREVDELRRRGWPVLTCLLTGGAGALAFARARCPEGARGRFLQAAAARVGEELLRAPGTALRLLRRLPQAADLACRTAANDSLLLHAHFAGITADLAAVAARTLDRPWTCSVHARDVFTCPPAALFRRLRSAKAITACSQAAAAAVISAGIPKERVSVIHHGLPLSDYAFGASHPGGRLFTACRLEHKKGVDTLLHACALLRKQGLSFTCAIAGSGPLQGALARQAYALGLSDSVTFLGWLPQEEIRSRVREASVLALPSRRTADGDRDGIANILVEALALGTPVVTTTASAASEVIADAVSGLLVAPDAPEPLARALAALLASSELRARLAWAGRQAAEQLFDGAANIRQLEALFTRAMPRDR
jgi:glycosyltransferase involved in cell wall biosynthesis